MLMQDFIGLKNYRDNCDDVHCAVLIRVLALSNDPIWTEILINNRDYNPFVGTFVVVACFVATPKRTSRNCYGWRY